MQEFQAYAASASQWGLAESRAKEQPEDCAFGMSWSGKIACLAFCLMNHTSRDRPGTRLFTKPFRLNGLNIFLSLKAGASKRARSFFCFTGVPTVVSHVSSGWLGIHRLKRPSTAWIAPDLPGLRPLFLARARKRIRLHVDKI